MTVGARSEVVVIDLSLGLFRVKVFESALGTPEGEFRAGSSRRRSTMLSWEGQETRVFWDIRKVLLSAGGTVRQRHYFPSWEAPFVD